MTYKIVITDKARKEFEKSIEYLIFEKNSDQAASSLIEDFENTKSYLKEFANSFKTIDNPELKKYFYRRINFRFHRYFIVYQIEKDLVIIEGIFHELQDYENKLK